jgi:hypothetical protein
MLATTQGITINVPVFKFHSHFFFVVIISPYPSVM